ncbi:MAG: hypothetical protein COB02_15560 [Candidatus Cloacimonadota bacterium]|nr:MAG: hypothetical protein COB02_15560 [Candidatus Cloacimonadota bacterium]
MKKNTLSLISLICAFLCFIGGFCLLFINDSYSLYPIQLLYLFLSFLAFTIVLEYKKILQLFSRSYYWFGLSHFYRSIAFISLISLLSVSSYQSKYFIDWTNNKTYSVSPDTYKFLENFDVKITLVANPSKHQNFYGPLDIFFTNIKTKSKNVTYKKVDPVQYPSFLEKNNIKSTPCVIISHGKDKQVLKRFHFFVTINRWKNKIKFTGESALIQAIIRLKNKQHLNILYPLHSKMTFLDESPHGFSYLQTLLINDGFNVSLNKESSLLNKSPLLMILNSSPISLEMEKQLIKRVESKLPTLIFIDALPKSPIKNFIQKFKLKVPGYVVLDPAKRLRDDLSLVSVSYSKHLVTRGLHPKNNPVILLSATAFIQQNKYKSIISSSNFSWMETNLNPTRPPQYEHNKDFKGPLNYGLELNEKSLIYSDTDLLKNQFLQLSGNQTLLLNSIHFILDNHNYLSSRGKDLQSPRIKVDKQDIRSFTIFILFLLPLLCLSIAGILQFLQYKS